MRCAHCKNQGPEVTVAHVKACSEFERHPAPAPVAVAVKVSTFADNPSEGIFFLDGTYYKVQQSEDTGRFYAKEYVEGEWLYRGRKPLHILSESDRVTVESAAKFGHVTGRCVFCSRKLTDERSIEVGYGPVCADHNGLPWGEK